MTRRVLVVRLDGAGDVLLAGPAVRAVAAAAGPEVPLLTRPGRCGGRRGCCPAWTDVLTWSAPWVLADPPPGRRRRRSTRWSGAVGRRQIGEAVVLTSFHQSPLPTALALRLAGVGRISGASVDYRAPCSTCGCGRADGPARGPARTGARRCDRRGGRVPRCPPDDDGRLAVREQAITGASRCRPTVTSCCTRGPPYRPAGGRPGTFARWPACWTSAGWPRRGHRRPDRARAHRRRRRPAPAPTSAAVPTSPSWPACLRRRGRGGGRQHRGRAPGRRRRHAGGVAVRAGGAGAEVAALPGAARAARRPAAVLPGHPGAGVPGRPATRAWSWWPPSRCAAAVEHLTASRERGCRREHPDLARARLLDHRRSCRAGTATCSRPCPSAAGGGGRPAAWEWPADRRRGRPRPAGRRAVDVVVLQRPEELDLAGRVAGPHPRPGRARGVPRAQHARRAAARPAGTRWPTATTCCWCTSPTSTP